MLVDLEKFPAPGEIVQEGDLAGVCKVFWGFGLGVLVPGGAWTRRVLGVQKLGRGFVSVCGEGSYVEG